MQSKDAAKLREKFKKNPFPHTHGFEKEIDLGSSTGDYVCPICGEDFSPEEKEKYGDFIYGKNQLLKEMEDKHKNLEILINALRDDNDNKQSLEDYKKRFYELVNYPYKK